MNIAMKWVGSIGVVMLLLIVAGCGAASVEDGFVDPDKNLSTLNGGVSVGRDAHVGDLRSVNGGIRVGDNSQVGQVSNVNGSIRLNPGSRARGIQSVNGSIKTESATVEGDVRSVNGGMRLGEGTEVGGDVRSINGGMRLTGTTVAGDVVTGSGDIELYDGTRVLGELRAEDSIDIELGNVEITLGRPMIVLHAGTVVEGKLRFDRDVHLWVHDTAEIGEVIGAEVKRFSGDSPPRK